MPSNPAVPALRLQGLGKMYKVFASRSDNLVDALGLARFWPGKQVRYQEFWALRDVDLEVRPGERVGILGRNGAGKSTLLKLMTGNLAPTTGSVELHGEVRALIDAGAGFHPDFTGYENIRAALTYAGMSPRQIADAEREIADFTELGAFLEQPFKTYSSGMQARLSFATATAVRPEILIVDEILGAGDAYFIGKSSERMKSLVEGGASVVLVTHALDQITLLCERAIWLDRGRVVKQGRAIDVVKAYQQYIRVLEDRRLRAKNRRATLGDKTYPAEENYSETLGVYLTLRGPAGASCDLREVRLLKDGEMEDDLLVGDAQDVDRTQSAFVVMEAGSWSGPLREGGSYSRRIAVAEGQEEAKGSVAFGLYHLFEDAAYEVEVCYRVQGAGSLSVSVWHAGAHVVSRDLPVRSGEWVREVVRLGQRAEKPPTRRGRREPIQHVGEDYPAGGLAAGDALAPLARARSRVPVAVASADRDPNGAVAEAAQAAELELSDDEDTDRGPSRWPGEGSILIEEVVLAGDDGAERAVFRYGDSLTLTARFRAKRAGQFRVLPVAVLYRIDGIKVSSQIGEFLDLELDRDEERSVSLTMQPLNLGDGGYTFTVALYKHLLPTGESEWYDLISQDYEFQVYGAPPFTGVFQHSGAWALG